MKKFKKISAVLLALVLAFSMALPGFAAKTIKVSSVTLSYNYLKWIPGKAGTLRATVKPTNATNKALVWKTSNAKVVTVTQTGKIAAKGIGSCTITATAKDGSGKRASCKIVVNRAVSSIKLNVTAVKWASGRTGTLKATVSPSNAENKAVSWKSSNTKIVTVDSTGKFTTKAKGNATVTCTAKDGSGKKATCKFVVLQGVTSIKLNYTAKTIYTIGNRFGLKATVSPATAYNKAVTWSSSNTAVATVNTNGTVTAKSSGMATITATAKDGTGKKASCVVTVSKAVDSLDYKAYYEKYFKSGSYTINGSLYIKDDADEIIKMSDKASFGITPTLTYMSMDLTSMLESVAGEEEFGDILKSIKVVKNAKGTYMLADASICKFYCTPEDLGGEIDDAFTDINIGDAVTGLSFVKKDTKTLFGTKYDTEIFKTKSGSITEFCFLNGVLKYMVIGDELIIKISGISAGVTASNYSIPAGYISLDAFMKIADLLG